ncbi:DUF2065 domain-containing protein [Rhodobacter sp. HX-7-19]|uniref:DUF2065 domain-containing protein n=1 Tax=Paragemmobacter kunshanensis TaxID=2583234 RepID=A0A6M1TNW5_9RHOB|nr:DUF2065 family protein [Rhodobacter kunshanensis]NGQ89818.1 DUF2065 domain-containing protein [Rhodobacter kunshanensis]
MTWALLGLGLVLVIEGLALALAPSRLEQVLALLAALGRDRRRLVGLISVALGTGLIWLARHLLA